MENFIPHYVPYFLQMLQDAVSMESNESFLEDIFLSTTFRHKLPCSGFFWLSRKAFFRNSNSLLILSLVIYKLSSKKGILKLETLTAVIKVKEIEKNIFASTKKIDITESGANKNKTYCMKNLWWCITRKLLYSLKRVLTYHRGLGERWETLLIGRLFGCINYHQLLMHI